MSDLPKVPEGCEDCSICRGNRMIEAILGEMPPHVRHTLLDILNIARTLYGRDRALLTGALNQILTIQSWADTATANISGIKCMHCDSKNIIIDDDGGFTVPVAYCRTCKQTTVITRICNNDKT